jgi:hypothetical protein
MREGFGSIFLYNLIIIFIILVFAFLAGTLTYYKAFKVNNVIISAIEKYEGYNKLSNEEINRKLNILGYTRASNETCPKKNNANAMKNISGMYNYCVYEFSEKSNFRSYGVITFITIDIPLINSILKIPVYSKTKLLYNF